MDYVSSLDVFGVPAKEIPCIPGKGPPDATWGAVGLLYLDTDDGLVYVCLSAENGVYVWQGLKGEKGADGKTAYQYAKEAGYTGTEQEFAKSLADLMTSGGGSGGIPVPETAEVGQFIVVSAVDDNGKVTATDAVTLADAEGVGF